MGKNDDKKKYRKRIKNNKEKEKNIKNSNKDEEKEENSIKHHGMELRDKKDKVSNSSQNSNNLIFFVSKKLREKGADNS